MPARRTSPRRAATRPSLAPERYDWTDDDVAAGSVLAGAGPWLGLLALVLAVGALGVVLLRGSGDGDLTACRTRAWAAVPKQGIPTGWLLGTTDMDANGITVSIIGPTPADGSNPPVVYATVTCYGSAAAQALEANRKAAEAAGATVQERQGGDDAWDISNKTTNSGTTIF